MINLENFEKGTVKLPSGKEEPGYYNTETKVFLPQERFLSELFDSYKEAKKEVRNKEQEIEKLKKTVKYERQKNNEKYDRVRQSAADRARAEICRAILEKHDLYRSEPIMAEFFLGYGDVIDLLKQKGLWR